MKAVRSISVSLPYRAIPKANKHKVAQSGGGRFAKRRVMTDLTGVMQKSEESFATRALAALDPHEREGLPWDGPISAAVEFVYPVTPSWPAWKREAAIDGAFAYTKTPDLENVAKFVWDALEGVFFTNDKLIFRQCLVKQYGEEARVNMTLGLYEQATSKSWRGGRT